MHKRFEISSKIGFWLGRICNGLWWRNFFLIFKNFFLKAFVTFTKEYPDLCRWIALAIKPNVESDWAEVFFDLRKNFFEKNFLSLKSR